MFWVLKNGLMGPLLEAEKQGLSAAVWVLDTGVLQPAFGLPRRG